MSESQAIDKTKVIVSLIAALSAILAAYWQFVWRPTHSRSSNSETQKLKYVGRVIDANTREPIQGAKVTFDFRDIPEIVYTDSEGVYRFTIQSKKDNLTGHVRVTAKGYEIYERNITLSSDNPTVADIRLTSH